MRFSPSPKSYESTLRGEVFSQRESVKFNSPVIFLFNILILTNKQYLTVFIITDNIRKRTIEFYHSRRRSLCSAAPFAAIANAYLTESGKNI